MNVVKNVMVPMRDGISLACDVYLPSDKGAWPIILFRTPYGRSNYVGWSFDEIVGDGYGIVCQDVRGTFDSEGEFSGCKTEGKDGEDTIAWLLQQAWCNGKVGTQGASYLAHVQWMTAIQTPKGLVTASPMSAGTTFEGREYISRGVLSLDLMFWYADQAVALAIKQGMPLEHPFLLTLQAQYQGLETLSGLASGSPEYLQQESELNILRQKALDQYRSLLSQSLYQMVELIAQYIPSIRNMVNNQTPECEYWQRYDWRGLEHEINIPMLHWGGWFDLFIRSVFKNYLAIPADKPFQKLIIAPVDHSGFLLPNADQNRIGEQSFPFSPTVETWLESKQGFSKDNVLRSWCDFWLKNKGEDPSRQAPITLFVMGANVWRDEWEWPLARTQWQKFFLDSNGNANTVSGDGRLVLEPPTGTSVDKYFYDPENPVPSRGGAVLGMLETAGSFDHQDIEQRQDILIYTFGPLSDDMEVTGPVSVTLYASTSAVDTDFTAKLLDVCDDGRAFNICDGVTRLRFRKNKPGLVTPNEIQQVDIELAPTSYVFHKGHCVRLEISSSAFPQFDPNPNTGNSLLLDENNHTVIARQIIYHQAQHHSYLTLPIIPSN